MRELGPDGFVGFSVLCSVSSMAPENACSVSVSPL